MKAVTTIGKSFPNLNARIASYDPATQFVNFEMFTAERFAELLAEPVKIGNEKDFSTILHEFRHAVDHLATLWGQQHLLKLHKALAARLSGRAEEFYHVIPYKQEESQLFHVEYYSETYSHTTYTGPDSRWRYTTSIGLRFDSDGRPDKAKPILFAKFATATGKALIRVPLTISALLETNAVAEEIIFTLGAYRQQYQAEDFPVYLKMYSDEFVQELLYNQNFAVYNVAVHIAANILGISDIVLAYRISSAIATVALNMTGKLAQQLPIPEEFVGEELRRSEALRQNNDRGFIFYTLCRNYAKHYEGGGFKLAALLKANNLPDELTFRQELSYEFAEIQRQMSQQNRFYPRFSIYNNLGFNVLVIGGIDGQQQSLLAKLQAIEYVPPTAFSGGEGVEVYNDALQRLATADEMVQDNSLWFNVVHDTNRMMEEFYTVRGL